MMKKRYLKILVSLVLIAIMSLSLFSCGQSKVEDDKDDWGNMSWEFKSGTLYITGFGDMPVVDSADQVGWASVRTGVTRVVFYSKDSKNVTNIANYAFYGMSNLTEISFRWGMISR